MQRGWQDLTADHGLVDSYQSVHRLVRALRSVTPLPLPRMECALGKEAPVDFGRGATIITPADPSQPGSKPKRRTRAARSSMSGSNRSPFTPSSNRAASPPMAQRTRRPQRLQPRFAPPVLADLRHRSRHPPSQQSTPSPWRTRRPQDLSQALPRRAGRRLAERVSPPGNALRKARAELPRLRQARNNAAIPEKTRSVRQSLVPLLVKPGILKHFLQC